ncbi:MAG TPA: AI-2E family transporter [Thermoleophilaceae bacterium]|nr:AI-2E family transporter [Thermoleophilaceae bacterium]
MSERRSTVAYRAVLLAAGLIVFGLLFQQLLTLLLAVLITVIVAIAISAFADRLERRHVPRPLGALLAVLLGLAVLAGILALIIPPFIDQTNEFADDVPGIVDDLRDQVHDVTGAEPGEISESIDSFVERYTDDPGKLIGPITSIGLGLAGVLAAFVLILITAYYMAVRPEPLIDGLRRLVPPAHREQADRIMGRLRRSWVGWMQGVAADMLISGVLLYIGLTLIGLDFAIFFAVLTALFSVIPYFGAIASGIPPVLFALTDSPGKALLVIVVYVAVQQIEGNLTIPLVMSRTVKMHPALIAGGVVVVGQLFGFVGLIVAVPILSMIVILVEELWVQPLEESHRLRNREAIDLPRLEQDLERERPTA